jgi:cyclomaltodextrinase / maltogenic alpha-amylase / neopullulanase
MTNELPPLKLGKYRHFKGGMKEVLFIASHSETLEKFVVYKSLYDSDDFPSGTVWIRPLSMFTESVMVDGKWVKRFEYCE